MNIALAILLTLIFTSLSSLHFYWGLGGEWGIRAAIPTNEEGKKLLNPGPAACFALGLILLSMAIFVMIQVKLLHIALWRWLDAYGFSIISFIFLLRAIGDFKYVGFNKRIKGTTFADADKLYFSPLCIIISLLTTMLALNLI
ncbi:hypothetical protein BEL04_06670 [Mucilaginibacter sp. PPCGB 2223]|uniref:DUF3995 domain-containing protein n=1 Tax=Mucilaginibacter sp. PPCGB 2223 TaxID=1886027 RepID=UPI0008242AB6|nr:DUF3995 domain-containing protein [Mucilaginibacter sp. PPCGB 2223]OCX53958.1 hypothetical protein BEL04_06670 [Mucilaginibacter sp. PPCGB 2223]